MKEDLRITRIPGKSGWSPTFADNELQMTSVMYPALRANSDYVYLELPFDKKAPKRKWKLRRLDYWAHTGNTTWAIEAKAVWRTVGSKSVRKSWESVVKQARDPTPRDTKVRQSKKIFRVAVLVIRIYEHHKNRTAKTMLSRKAVEKLAEKLKDNLDRPGAEPPNWSATWRASGNMQEKTRVAQPQKEVLRGLSVGHFFRSNLPFRPVISSQNLQSSLLLLQHWALVTLAAKAREDSNRDGKTV